MIEGAVRTPAGHAPGAISIVTVKPPGVVREMLKPRVARTVSLAGEELRGVWRTRGEGGRGGRGGEARQEQQDR